MSLYTEFHVKYGRLPTENDPDYLRELERKKLVSKFQVLERPLLHPARCVGCLSDKVGDRLYIDFNTDTDFYWGTDHKYALYICTLCIKELASIIGMVEPPPDKEDEPKPSLSEEIMNAISMAMEVIHSRYIEGKVEDGMGVADGSDTTVDGDNIHEPDEDSGAESGGNSELATNDDAKRSNEQSSSSDFSSLAAFIEEHSSGISES